MNILFLMKNYQLGGIEIVTQVLANKFVLEGHHVCIFSFESPENSIDQYLNFNIRIYTVDNKNVSSENINKLRDILIKEKIEIIINQWGLPCAPTLIAQKAKKKLNIKYISVYHNSPDANARIQSINIALSQTNNWLKKNILKLNYFIYKQITRHSMRYVYSQSDLYLVLSPSFIGTFKKFTGLKDISKLKVQTNPLTIESDKTEYYSKQKEIIYVGRIDYNQKRVNRVIDVWNILENKLPGWKLTIIGDGIEKKKLEDKVCELNLKNVHFEGFQDPKLYYKRARLLVLTSEYEGFGLVVLEAMSFGVIPFVYGSYSAIYDIINNEKDGFIIPPTPQKGFIAQNMADKIITTIQDSSLIEELSNQAIQTSKTYSLDNVYESWNNLFKTLK